MTPIPRGVEECPKCGPLLAAREQWIASAYPIPGMCWPVELGWLYDNLAASRSHAEVGSYAGRSLWASVGGMADGSTVFAVESGALATPRPSPQWIPQVLECTLEAIDERRPGLRVELLEMDSLTASRALLNREVLLDSVYIDADHNYAECLADIHTWRPLVKPGGLVCGHDFWPADVGVMDAVHEAFEGRASAVRNSRIWFARV